VAVQRKRPRIVGTAIAAGLVGAVAIAIYSGVSAPGFGPTSSASPNSSETSADSSSEVPHDGSDSSADSGSFGIPSGTFPATVTYVHDGDTLYLDTGSAELKVRLIGIDTPELDSQQNRSAGECYGEEARELLRDFLPEGTQVSALEDREPEDRYGRSLLYVYLDDGTFVNLAMVQLGAATSLKIGLNNRFWPELRDAEDDAYTAGLGMWGRC
jgi:micrococcal nuclease